MDSLQSVPFSETGQRERQKSPGLKELKKPLAEGCHFSAVTFRVTCWKRGSNWGLHRVSVSHGRDRKSLGGSSLLKTLLIFLTFFIFFTMLFFLITQSPTFYQYQSWQWNNKLLEQCFLKLGSFATCVIICLKGRFQTPFRPMWWNRWQLVFGILPFNKFPRWFWCRKPAPLWGLLFQNHRLSSCLV